MWLVWFLFASIAMMFAIVCALAHHIYTFQPSIDCGGRTYHSLPITSALANRPYKHFNTRQIDFVCISLPKRQAKQFTYVKDQLAKQTIDVVLHEGIDGKKLKPEEFNLAQQYKSFFANNWIEFSSGRTQNDYRGHLGCTLSHLQVIDSVRATTVVLEDDVSFVQDFRPLLESTIVTLEKQDPEWDILLLGWSCNYNDHGHCMENDVEPVVDGLTKVHYFFGGWAYMIRSKEVARRILDLFDPIPFHIDLTLADAAMHNKLKVYGCVPTLVNHAGELRISSHDYTQVGNVMYLKTDTNR